MTLALPSILSSLSPADLAELHRHAQRHRLLSLGLLDFIPHISPQYVSPLHLAPLASLIERCEREPVRALVSIPPRMGKTESLMHGVARYLARNPAATVAFCSYNKQIAYSKSRLARDYARRAGVRVRPDAVGLGEWRSTLGGGMLATGVGGALTGHGCQLLVVDDPIKNREEAESRVVRDALYEWFTSTALTRLEPGASVIVNMARWHGDDLIGRLARAGGPWEVVNIPALDEDGAALWPDQWSAAALEEKRAEIGEYDFASLYLGSPRLRGTNLFQEPARYAAPEITGRRILIGVDVAATAKTRSDYSCAIVLAVTGAGKELRADVLEVWRAQQELPQVARELGRLQSKWNAPLVVEAAGVGKAVPQLLREIGGRLRVHEVHPKADKFLRAQPLAAAWNDGRVRLPATDGPWIRPFLSEVLNFTGVRDDHDDQVDALAHAWNHAVSTAPVRPVALDKGPFAHAVGAGTPRDAFGRPLPGSP